MQQSWVDRRRLTFVSIVAFLALLVAIPLGALAQTTSSTYVKGTISTKDAQSYSGNAIAIITLIDRSARGDGVIVGQQRIAAPATPLSFKVRYDPSRINQSHAYVVFAAIVDGAKQWHNNDGVPVITGGPTSGVDVRVAKVTASPVATIPGEITKKDKANLSDKAVALAAVLDVDTGRTVAWTAITPSGQVPVDFTLGYDPATVNPGANLVAWAAIVDKLNVWESDGASPLLAAGSNLSAGSIAVFPATTLPAAPSPTPTPTPVTIPAVKNQPEAKAVQTLNDAGLVVGETGRSYNANVAKGNAIKTNPEAGNTVPAGSSVKLIVSKGPSPSPSPTPTPKPTAKPTPTPTPKPTAKPTPTPVTVPDVRNQSEADAVITLTNLGLVIGERARRFNEKVKSGNVIKTEPVAGTSVKSGSTIDLFISKGPSPSPSPTPRPTQTTAPQPTPSPVAVPDVRNQSEADAVITLTDAGLKIGARARRFNEKVASGNAIKTEPVAGTKVKVGSAVDLFISKGPEPTASPSPTPTPKPTATPRPTPVVVPTVKGMPEADAVVELTDADLKVGDRIRRTNETVAAGSVFKTDPAGGSSVQPGTRIDLFISTGPEATPTPAPIKVPDVRGMSEPDAIIALTDADLQIGQRFRERDPNVEAGLVIDTDPGAASKVTPGTFVDLFVSDGPAPTPTPSPTPEPSPSPVASPSPSASVAPWPYPTAGVGFVSGSLIYRQSPDMTANRQVVITLLEEGPDGSRVVPAEQFVADGSAPLGFALSFDWAEIDPSASYRVLAAITDGAQSWYSLDGAPTITGGAPISGLIVALFERGDILEGQVSGVIVGVDADLSAAATREAFLVRSDTGEVIAFDSAAASTTTRVQAFSVPFLLGDIDPDVEYLLVARVIDGPRIWTGPGVPVVTNDAFRVVVPVSLITGVAPQLDTPGS